MRKMEFCESAAILIALVVVGAGGVSAEDFEKRFRVGASFGMYNAQDGVRSDSANDLILVDRELQIEKIYTDPRDDSAVFGKLEIQPGTIGTLSAQYALTKIFVVEASVGYQKTDLGDVEVQAQFQGVEVPEIERVLFAFYRVPVGEIEQVPIQLTMLARFRPRTSLNPYLGGGFGYTLIGFSPSAEFDQLSLNMDRSRGGQSEVSSVYPSDIGLSTASQIGDLTGAKVDARDTWTAHLVGGMEYTFKRRWAAFLDLRYSVSARAAEVSFNGGSDLGIAVPNYTAYDGTVSEVFGPIQINNGGIIDGGRLAPIAGSPPNTDCVTTPSRCEFVFEPDGVVDPGFYYVQGGKIRYDAFSAQLGVRFTF